MAWLNILQTETPSICARSTPNQRAQSWDAAESHELRGEPEEKTIEGGQIRRVVSRPIANQDLMLEQQ